MAPQEQEIGPTGESEGPTIHPLHPRFLSSYPSISQLVLTSTTFRSFSELARMLHSLPNLEALSCYFVRWITLGSWHPGPEPVKQPGHWAAGMRTFPPFAPKLRRLKLWDIIIHGAETLISTRGPHLTWLFLMIPLLDSLENCLEEPTHGGGIDLSSCLRLRKVCLTLGPGLSIDTHTGRIEWLLNCQRIAIF
ncbi:hypothetical protein LXA43DRAFT_1046540 [Ganoderma leucocontextum]|nr:hypothetical protein LXA43DRAFT_1046540 [Ganoderma leucocontextum]